MWTLFYSRAVLWNKYFKTIFAIRTEGFCQVDVFPWTINSILRQIATHTKLLPFWEFLWWHRLFFFSPIQSKKELHWLPVSQRIVFKLMLIVHKSVNNIAPIYISELLKVYTPSRNLRSSNMSLLKEPTSKRTWGDRSFSVAAPRLWNHLSN